MKKLENRLGKVYRITCIITGKIYVGSTIQKLETRWYHYQNLNCTTQKKIYRSLIKYGIENHIFELMWEGDIRNMLMYECLIGTYYEVLSFEKGLTLKLPKYSDEYQCVSQETKELARKNQTGKKYSEESKFRMKIAQAKINERGKKFSFEALEKIRISSTGRKHSDETKLKMSILKTGTKCSDETKKLKSKQTKEFWANNPERSKAIILARCRAVLKFDLNDNLLEEYISPKEAGIKNEFKSATSIANYCNNKVKKQGKFKWKWKYEKK